MRLKYQLFITLLIASALLVALMFAVSSASFSRGFLRYINNAEQERVQQLAAELEKQYARDGSWDNTRQNSVIIRSLLRSAGDRRWPRQNDDQRLRKKPPLAPNRTLQRLILTDADKHPILGRLSTSNRIDWQTINHNNEVVGYVGIKKLKKLDNKLDRTFERQQRKGFALAGLSMVLLSAVLAAPLAARIVKPILKVKKTVAELSDGNFTDRIKTTRRDEIGDLSRDINKLGATLAKNKDQRLRHFAEISHELRTPIGVVQAELEALQDGVRPLDQHAVNSLHSETLRIKRLIEDLHTMSLADAGALDYQMQAVDIVACVETQIERHRQTNPGIDIKLHTPFDVLMINADKQRLEQLFDNLLQNTVRYTNLPGKLHITLTTDHDQVTLNWKDSAPGVTPDVLDKL